MGHHVLTGPTREANARISTARCQAEAMSRFVAVLSCLPVLARAFHPSMERWAWSGPVVKRDPEAELLDAMITTKPMASDLISRVEAIQRPVVFDEEMILGDWQLRYQYNSKDATRSQKALSGKPQFSNFITDDSGRKVFRNIAAVTKNRVQVVADVAYEPESSPGRLSSTICAAAVELSFGRRWNWKPLRVPLPLRGEGWLDVTYLSKDMRVTRGNRGGLFVHVRPNLVADY